MQKRRFTLSLRTALIGVNLIVLILPLAGIQLLRLYESSLVRQTESSLIAQGAFVAAFYRSLIIAEGTHDFAAMSVPLPAETKLNREGEWIPRPAVLDLADSVYLPPFPDPEPAQALNPETQRLGALLNPTLKDAQLTTLAGIRVVDTQGTIVASTGEDLGLSIAHGEEVRAALNGIPTSHIRRKKDPVETNQLDGLSRTSRVRIFVSHPIVLHDRLIGAVLLSRTPPSILQALYAKRDLLILSGILLLTLVVLMASLTHRLITRPMSRLVNYAHTITSGESKDTELSPGQLPRLRELAQLQTNIMAMAESLEERARYLQDYARHISHEFKTPLASIRGAIELLQDHRNEMSDEQYQRFMNNAHADTDRLQRLTDRLNELTQAELRPLSPMRQPLLPLVQEASIGLRAAKLDICGSLEGADARVDADTLTSILTILFDNAEHHCATRITASWHDNALYIGNDGEPISNANRSQIFTPFFTTRREQGGTGLGLSIARTLLSRLGAQIELDPNSPQPQFMIRFA